jgi:N-acetyl-anhydromuramyl-L-alanine amidase AmpD
VGTLFEIKWVGSPNYYKGRSCRIIAIVNHIMCGTLSGTDSWFQNRASQVSAHYGVGKDGSIHQYVRDEDTAWAVGLVQNPTWRLYNQVKGHVNSATISIEHEGHPEDGLTEAQYQATLWLHRKLIAEHGIPVDRDHIIGHCELDSVNRRDCPGPKFPWDRLFRDLGAVDLATAQKGGEDDVLVKELPTLHQGATGHVNAVKAVQAIVGVTVDGVFGPQTEAAVKRWQAEHKLVADGIVGPKTWAAMFN